LINPGNNLIDEEAIPIGAALNTAVATSYLDNHVVETYKKHGFLFTSQDEDPLMTIKS
jgi:hypothetical protein